MGWPHVLLLLLASVGLSGCSVSYSSQESVSKLTAGFWFWHGSSTDSALSGEPLDSLFVHVGSIQQVTAPIFGRRTNDGGEQWHVYGALPRELPAAREYWLVFRFERQGVPDLRAAPMVAGEVSRLRAAARQRNLNVAGVQLDIDSPTGALAQYASFLREVRKELPQGSLLSITALLDWFRSGTAIAEVIRETDEFVPQFL